MNIATLIAVAVALVAGGFVWVLYRRRKSAAEPGPARSSARETSVSDVDSRHAVPKRRIELIPGQLWADVYQHDLQAGPDSIIPCWSYVSNGLSRMGQAEIVFSLVRGKHEAAAPVAPFKLFRTIHAFAAAGRIVTAGGMTQFADDDFFHRHLVYIPVQTYSGLEIPTSSICAILVTQDELQAVGQFGITRVMARLGSLAGYYPCPPWSDRARPGISFTDTRRGSMLARVEKLLRPGCSVLLVNDEVVLRLDRAARNKLATEFEDMPDAAVVGLLTQLDSDADGCFVWEPGQSGPAAITPPGSVGERLCGCFLLFATGQREDGVRLLEDGFAGTLTASSWRAVREAIKGGNRVRIPANMDGSKSFVVEPAEPDAAATRTVH